MTSQRRRVFSLARVAADDSRKARLAALRSAADEVRYLSSSAGIYNLSELEEVIARQERLHRSGRRFSCSVPVAVDYFLIRVLSHAAELLSGRSAKKLTAGLAGARTDYLIGFSIYARYRSEFQEAGFTRANLSKLAELADYCDDIAG